MPVSPPTHSTRVALFGNPKFVSSPRTGSPEAVQFTGDWVRENLVSVHVPVFETLGLVRSPLSLHTKAAGPFLRLVEAWESADLLQHLRSFDGAWVPRFKRQKGNEAERRAICAHLPASSLSNHAFGTAIDFNARELPLGRPALPDHPFHRLAAIANELGWSWGGHYATRPDPQHFELARV